MIEGIIITPLKKIHHTQGDIYHAMKKSDPGFDGFGEAYFSTIKQGEIKAWKKHTQMTLNLVVPIGKIKFVIYDGREGSKTRDDIFEIVLSPDDYKRLTIPPNLWMGFQGLGEGLNLLLNLANIEHDPDESEKKDVVAFKYSWEGLS